MVKRSAFYRRIRCHLSSTCPEDVWADEGRTSFVVFRLVPGIIGATHLAFAVDPLAGEVTRVRTLAVGPDSVRGGDPDGLPGCPPRSRGYSDPPAAGEGERVD